MSSSNRIAIVGSGSIGSLAAVIALTLKDKGLDVVEAVPIHNYHPIDKDCRPSAKFKREPEPWQMKHRRHR